MNKRQTERARIKAFYRLLVERMGQSVWDKRRAALIDRIRAQESTVDRDLPIESQMFEPPENDIDWYILVAELAYDVPHSDVYSSKRIYPYAMALGAFAEELKELPNVGPVLDKMLVNKSHPETQLFELLTAAFYLKNGYDVTFIPENSIDWPDGKTKKTPDLLVTAGDIAMYVECKRAAKQTQYAQEEEQQWGCIWPQLSRHLLTNAPWHTVDLTFHSQLVEVTAEQVIAVVDQARSAANGGATSNDISARIRQIDVATLQGHYAEHTVRANSAQHQLLVFGDLDSNEKRSIATIADGIVRPGGRDAILNTFVQNVGNCVAAQWRCDHAISFERRSRHFKSLLNKAIGQLPPDKPGIVHILYETVEGISAEELRSDKNLASISGFDAEGTSFLAVLIHGVNYYPFAENYDWAETVQDFARVPNAMKLFRDPLMLSPDDDTDIARTSHWLQDKANKHVA